MTDSGSADAPAPNTRLPHLTLIIPAFNEASRIESTLLEALRYLSGLPYPTELILADDGSTDATAEISGRLAATAPTLRVLSIRHAGKAAAVHAGMSSARGACIAFTDADLATPLDYLASFVDAAGQGWDVVIGSREGSGASRIGEPWYRHVMGRVFNRLVQLLLLPGIEDTQCGFKLFTKSASESILDRALLYTDPAAVSGARVTAFDVELLVIAKRLKLAIRTEPVVWTYGSQSKVSPARDTWTNALDIWRVFVNLRRGRYDRRETAAVGGT